MGVAIVVDASDKQASFLHSLHWTNIRIAQTSGERGLKVPYHLIHDCGVIGKDRCGPLLTIRWLANEHPWSDLEAVLWAIIKGED